MTLDTDAIREAAKREIHGACYELSPNAKAVQWAVRARQLCDALDAAAELGKDRNNLRERLDVATSDCITLMGDLNDHRADVQKLAHEKLDIENLCRSKERDVTLLGKALDATAKERDDAVKEVESNRFAELYVQDLKAEVFELKTRLDVAIIGLRSACTKRAETRATLTKAFADLSNALVYTFVPNVGDARALRDVVHKLHVAVSNS